MNSKAVLLQSLRVSKRTSMWDCVWVRQVEVEAIALQGPKTAVAKVADFQFLVAWGQTEILISAEKTALTKAIALANLGLLIQTEVRPTAPHMMKGSSIATS